ncbi:MAG: hypothetical protein Q8L23_18460 [Caulobacter sp.]|nr:hypothetical protein [Caulobacter sp.]
MDLFGYAIPLVSVLLALGLARVLESHANLLKRQGDVAWSPTYLIWLILIVALHIDLWVTLWIAHTLPNLDSGGWGTVSPFLFQAVCLFYAAVLSTPHAKEGEPLDLWQFHIDNRKRYLTALIVYAAAGIGLGLLVQLPTQVTSASVPMVGLALVAIFVSNRWVQLGAAGATLIWTAVHFAKYLSDFMS